MKIIVFIISLFIHYVLLEERFPRPLSEEDYKLLKECLKKGKIDMKHKNSKQVRKVYRLVKSGKYSVRNMIDPISNEETEKVVC